MRTVHIFQNPLVFATAGIKNDLSNVTRIMFLIQFNYAQIRSLNSFVAVPAHQPRFTVISLYVCL